ncbi:MAG: RNA polymerase sigma factor [Bacteroidales bacterium]
MHDNEDRHFIERVLDGEPDAYAFLVEKYKTMAYNISLKIVKRQEDAEEITQDSFFRAYKSLRSFKGDAKFSTWLYRIVYNASVSHTRKKKREMPVDEQSRDFLKHPDMVEDGEGETDESLSAALKKAVDSLPSPEQTMINLYYYENSNIEDIARIMSLSASNVKVKLFRIRKKLYDHIKSINQNSESASIKI